LTPLLVFFVSAIAITSMAKAAKRAAPHPLPPDLEKGDSNIAHMLELELKHAAKIRQLKDEHDIAFRQLRDEHDVAVRELENKADILRTDLERADKDYWNLRSVYESYIYTDQGALVKALEEEIMEVRRRNDDPYPT